MIYILSNSTWFIFSQIQLFHYTKSFEQLNNTARGSVYFYFPRAYCVLINTKSRRLQIVIISPPQYKGARRVTFVQSTLGHRTLYIVHWLHRRDQAQFSQRAEPKQSSDRAEPDRADAKPGEFRAVQQFNSRVQPKPKPKTEDKTTSHIVSGDISWAIFIFDLHFSTSFLTFFF